MQKERHRPSAFGYERDLLPDRNCGRKDEWQGEAEQMYRSSVLMRAGLNEPWPLAITSSA